MTTRIVREERAANVLNFLSNLQIALVVYFTPVFLVDRGVPVDLVGLVYSLGALISIPLLLYSSFFLRRFGNYTLFLGATISMAGCLLLIGFVQSAIGAALYFAGATVMWALTSLSLDEFLQVDTHDNRGTGLLRGIFITMASIAFAIAPIAAGQLSAGDEFVRLFIVTALLSVPMLIIAGMGLSHFKDAHYHSFNAVGMLRIVREHKNIRVALVHKLLLYMFYGATEVYALVYLHDHLGFSLEQIGTMLSIALVAFVLVEVPVGYMADTLTGEREILTIGFILLGTTVFAMGFMGPATFVAWTALMFASRVGAALVEIGGESYFFKQVKGRDSDEIGLYRAVSQLGLVLGPLVGSLILGVLSIDYVFVSLGAIVLLGIPSAMRLSRTR